MTTLVTDGDPQYDDIIKNIAKDLEIDKIIHQLCVFHALKNLSKATRKARKNTKSTGIPLGNSIDIRNSARIP